MRFRGVFLAAAILAAPFAASAQPIQGPYLSGGLGLHVPQAPRVTPTIPGFGGSNLTEKYGFDAVGALGYGLGNGWRFEVEGDFSRSGVHGLHGSTLPVSTSGSVRTYGVMANALFDMDVGFPWMFPYVGAGAGYQWTNLSGVSFTQQGGPLGYRTDDKSGAFAWQAILGASFPIPNLPGLSATVDYRFMDILGGEKFAGTESLGGGVTAPATLKLHNQFNHSIVFGVRYAFNTPAPAMAAAAPMPAAAPAPAPSRSYLVFFDWDKATLTDRARSIVKEAADNSTRVQYTRIEVNGYTDTSGTPQYNQGLSVRRAQAVAGELVRNGVPKDSISIKGLGDTNLLVPTGAGVREAQNRRVEIIIR